MLLATGCLTYYSNADHELGAMGGQILDRDYIVTSDTPFALTEPHLSPIGFGAPYDYGEHATVDLAAGTHFHTQYIQHYWSHGIDGDEFSKYVVHAIVTDGPHKDTLIGIVYEKLLPPLKIAAAPVANN